MFFWKKSKQLISDIDFQIKIDSIFDKIIESKILYGNTQEPGVENSMLANITGLIDSLDRLLGQISTEKQIEYAIDSFVAHQSYKKGSTIFESKINGMMNLNPQTFKGIAFMIFEHASKHQKMWKKVLVSSLVLCQNSLKGNQNTNVSQTKEGRKLITIANLMLIDGSSFFLQHLQKTVDLFPLITRQERVSGLSMTLPTAVGFSADSIKVALDKKLKYTDGWKTPFLETYNLTV